MPSQLDTQPEELSRDCPVEAFQLRGAPVEFGADGEAAGDDALIPIKMFARSAKPTFHWYWGKIAHDLSGMSRKSSVPVDWLHDDNEVIGYVDTEKVTRKGLELSGALVPYPADPADRATEIAYRGQRGVPYEASIDFRGGDTVIEEVGGGQTVQVNGYKFEGPGYVVRQWTLRGMAICPHGADKHTETKFSEGEGETVSVRIFKSEETMSEATVDPAAQADEPLTKKGFLAALQSAFGFGDTAAATDAGGDEVPQPEAAAELADVPADKEETPAEPTAAELKAELKRFSDAFGEDGPKLFAAELTFEEAAVRVIGQLRDRNEELEKRLSAVDRGDTEGAEFQEGDEDPVDQRTRELSLSMDEGSARRAALMAKHRGKLSKN